MTPREMIEWIQNDVNQLCEQSMRPTKPTYLAASADVAKMQRDFYGETASDHGRLAVCTPIGFVEVVGDPNFPVDRKPFRAYRCQCGATFLDDSSRSGKCGPCRMLGGRPDSRAPTTTVKLNLDGPSINITGSITGGLELSPERAGTVTNLEYDNDHLRWQAIPGMGWVAVPPTTSTLCARCSTPLQVTDATADAVVREHEARCFVVGDWVRWNARESGAWVIGLILMINAPNVWIAVSKISGTDVGPAVGDEWQAGIAQLSRILPASHASRLTEYNQAAKQLAEARLDPAQTYGVFDAARRRVEYLATMPMPPIVYPPLPMGLAADLVPAATRTPPLRPDGFDQSRIDMLKAAMLAPSVKVKR